MLHKLYSHFADILYVQIWEDKIKVTNVDNKSTFEDAPFVIIKTTDKGEKVISGIGEQASKSLQSNEVVVNPFSHPRVLFSDFYVGEKLLQHIFRELKTTKWLRPKPKVVVHPMEKTEGGLTMIETRAFRELAFGAGAIDVKVRIGQPLSISIFDFDSLTDNEGFQQTGLQRAGSTSNIVVLVFYLVIIGLAVWYYGN